MIHEFFGRYTYLFLDLASLFFPLILSFDKKVHFYTYWWRLFPAMLVGATSFLIWDEWFTRMQVWSFAPEYITGIYWGHLPLEEWLFFICIPFSCMFIYECLRAYFKDYLKTIVQFVWLVFLAAFAILAIVYHNHVYTFITFTGAALMLVLHWAIFRTKYMGYFFMMWVIHLIPLFIVNGYLTGIPVVMYNNAENMGIRIGTVPLEDSFYSMFLLLINITVYEWMGQKWAKK